MGRHNDGGPSGSPGSPAWDCRCDNGEDQRKNGHNDKHRNTMTYTKIQQQRQMQLHTHRNTMTRQGTLIFEHIGSQGEEGKVHPKPFGVGKQSLSLTLSL